MGEEKSLWERFVGAVKKLWCYFVTIAVFTLVWMLVGYAIVQLALLWWSIVTSVIIVAAPTGIVDVIILIVFIIVTIILIILLYHVIKEIWGWSKRWFTKRVQVCK